MSVQLDSQSLYIPDEQGNDKRMVILFTFDSPDNSKHYVIYQDPEGDEEEVFASQFTDEGELIPIEDESEWEMVEEVVSAFSDEEEEA